jgi:YHS domain-containing protein
MCPVSWKVHKKFVNCAQKPENAVLYKDAFYFFASRSDRDVFVKNPKQFTERVLFCQDRNVPKRYRAHKAAEIISQEKALLGHCTVTLKDEERIEKGY